MSKKEDPRAKRADGIRQDGDPAAARADRRQFLGGGMAFGTGGLLASLGLSRYANAQNTAPAPATGPRPTTGPGSARGPGGFGRPEPKYSQPPPLKHLRGKVAYVSAASDGIGLGIARAASLAGMKVVIGYRNSERLAAALPLFEPDNPGVLPVKHDVTDRDGWQRMLDEVVKHYGKLHLVVNNAGVKILTEASKATYAQWDNAVAVNFTAIYNSVHVCLPHMLQHGEGGHFVTTASMGGLLPGVNAGVYTSTKIAAVGLMEALRIELESTNIGTGVFCPGGVNTNNYAASGKVNPYLEKRLAQMPARFRRFFERRGPSPAMDPLEAGERVLNGVVHNDLFILSHPEFKPGMAERFEAIMDSTPAIETPIPPERIAYERGVLTCGIYPREIAHRKIKRKSYLTV